MAKHLLCIDADDLGNFTLAVKAGTMTIGGSPQSSDVVLPDLLISRIYVEVEVQEDRVVLNNPLNGTPTTGSQPPLSKELLTGQAVQFGNAYFRFEAAEAESEPVPLAPAEIDDVPALALELLPEPTLQATAAPPVPAPARPVASTAGLAKRFQVIDGADTGRFYPLPQSGTVTIGKNKKHADIPLNDLYVARVHCELHIDGDQITVVHLTGQNGTLINGKQITRQELFLGDVLRVGNSHLRLETAVEGAGSALDEDAEPVGFASEQGDSTVDEDDFEIIDEPAPSEDQSFCLPHAPVDQLLKLEDQVLGHFQIGPLLGRGQSSLVFRAEDVRNNHVVALKVMSPDFPKSEAELQCFVKALKIVPNMQHPNLVTLHGAGKTGPYSWIAREYVEGEGAARLISRLKEGGKFDWTRSCRVAVHIGKVLEFLHKKGVTHGNITPRNVLVRHIDKTTKLTDLMLNQALEGSHLQKAVLARKLFLELPYMSPEQADAHASVAPVSDLYTLGAVLYALLTGQPPFSGDSPKEILSQVREAKVVKPSKLQKGIPPDMEAAVLKLMARNPAERFQSATELLAVVENIAREHDLKM